MRPAGAVHIGRRRPGGPHALVTGRGVFDWDRTAQRFCLRLVHPGESVDSIRTQTGFSFDVSDDVRETPPPDEASLAAIRGPIAEQVAGFYPEFASRVWSVAA